MDSKTLRQMMSARLIGQQQAIDAIVPLVSMYSQGMNPAGRPIGSVMLLGPTGTGKTRTVEVLAECLHGTSASLLRIDCGSLQQRHETSKLDGAAPGYVGHRETKPLLSADRLSSITSPACSISVVLFDEIEKANDTVHRILLSILDKGLITLSDNSVTDFTNSLIFMTSNLGAKQIADLSSGGFGLAKLSGSYRRQDDQPGSLRRTENIGMDAAKRKFSPEFINRIDEFVTFAELTKEQTRAIVDLELTRLDRTLRLRKPISHPVLEVRDPAKDWLAEKGTSPQYGARELRRVIQKHVVCKLALMSEDKRLYPGAWVVISAKKGELDIRVKNPTLISGRKAA